MLARHIVHSKERRLEIARSGIRCRLCGKDHSTEEYEIVNHRVKDLSKVSKCPNSINGMHFYIKI